MIHDDGERKRLRSGQITCSHSQNLSTHNTSNILLLYTGLLEAAKVHNYIVHKSSEFRHKKHSKDRGSCFITEMTMNTDSEASKRAENIVRPQCMQFVR